MRPGSRRLPADGFSSRWPASFLLSLVAHAAVLALLAGAAPVRLDLVPTTIDLAFLDASDRSAGPGEVARELRLAAPPPPQAEAAPPSPPSEPEMPREEPAPEPVPAPPKRSVEPQPASEPKPAPEPAAREASPPRPTASLPPTPAAPSPAGGAGAPAVAGPSRSSGSDTRSTAPAWAPTARVRYEQVLYAWLERHKQYPMLAQRRRIEGEGSVRVVIDRTGRVLERSVARSTGEPMLDQALLDVVRRANPFPAVPFEYAGDTFEFTAPIKYRLR